LLKLLRCSSDSKSFRDFNQVVRVLLILSSSKRALDINQVVRGQGDVNGSEDWKEYGYQ